MVIRGAKDSMAASKERLDVALVRRGLVGSREKARALIMAGQVYVGDRMVDKPGTLVALDANCRIADIAPELKYVSRGGLKLEKALDTFQLNPDGLVAIDVGASTGGFTQCLLERGAQRVYAVDVGHGQLAWTLRNDPRVVVMERTNIRNLSGLRVVHLTAPGSARACSLARPYREYLDRLAGQTTV
jgi:23S rRNA (cytidine1920-2'-O)/16S rRNA (cytidine1409-2'-O)-methyltransferase